MILSFGWILIIPQLRNAPALSLKHLKIENLWFSHWTSWSIYFQVLDKFANRSKRCVRAQAINFKVRQVLEHRIGYVFDDQGIHTSQRIRRFHPVKPCECRSFAVSIVVPLVVAGFISNSIDSENSVPGYARQQNVLKRRLYASRVDYEQLHPIRDAIAACTSLSVSPI